MTVEKQLEILMKRIRPRTGARDFVKLPRPIFIENYRNLIPNPVKLSFNRGDGKFCQVNVRRNDLRRDTRNLYLRKEKYEAAICG